MSEKDKYQSYEEQWREHWNKTRGPIYDLNNYPEDVRTIVEILLDWESGLSDGYADYTGGYTPVGDDEDPQEDRTARDTIAALTDLARELVGAVRKEVQT